jgi:hypothetical protein
MGFFAVLKPVVLQLIADELKLQISAIVSAKIGTLKITDYVNIYVELITL